MFTGLYIHIPFCVKKCLYCDFASYPVLGEKADHLLWERYIQALIEEFKLKASFFSAGNRRVMSQPQLNKFQTVFIGGGTPSILPVGLIARLMKEISPFVAKGAEITIEANPGTLSKDKLKAYRKAGINRLSIGAQSFNPELLKTIGRIHSPEDILLAFLWAREAGFKNINLDFIFALPGQTFQNWEDDLTQSLTLRPEHLSAYSLQIEEGTPLASQIRTGQLDAIDEETELEMYQYTIETLKSAGYHHYEISNFSRPGDECRHNLNYWKNGDYLGIGAAAHSHMNGHRFSNPSCLEEYFLSLKNQNSYLYEHASSAFSKERIMVGLRLIDGIDLTPEEISENREAISQLKANGMIDFSNRHLKLTPKGLPLANEVFMAFL